jgi:hypothetical protein
LGQGVESSLASEVGITQVVQDKESITTSSTSWILTSIWHGRLALVVLNIVVSVVGAGESSVESIGTLVVAVTDVVGQVESVGDSSTSWVTASRWQVGTALVAGKIEILSLVASEGGVESILASEV